MKNLRMSLKIKINTNIDIQIYLYVCEKEVFKLFINIILH